MSKKYRFDNAYEKVYENHAFGYHYIGSYFAYGITKKMSYIEAEAIVDRDWKESMKNDSEFNDTVYRSR